MKQAISGIYCIENLTNNKKYIGYAKDIFKRWNDHKNQLKRSVHANRYLQGSFDKHGEDNFIYYIVQEMEYNQRQLKLMEIYWIAYYNSFIEDGCGYNLTRGGDGTSLSKETKEKISKSMMGKMVGEKNPMWKKVVSEETKEKMRKSHPDLKGEKSPNFGRHFETSEETRKKLSIAGKGRTHSEESKKKISKFHKGKIVSEETRKKLSESHKELRTAQGRTRGNKKFSSQYAGVCAKCKKWASKIRHNGILYYLGLFVDEIDAARAYDLKALELYGPNANLNFPNWPSIENEEVKE